MNSDIKNFRISHTEEEKKYEMPNPCEESEKALEVISKDNIKAQYDFISIVVVSFVFLVVSAIFIVFTSSQRFGDEGNQFSLKRLFSGDYTREMQSRYESTIPFPEQITWLNQRISFVYGVGNKIDKVQEDLPQISVDEIGPNNNHDENVITSATTQEEEDKETKAKKDDEEKVTKEYATTYRKETSLTTSSTTTTTKIDEVTNNDAPNATKTVTYPPETTIATTTPKETEPPATNPTTTKAPQTTPESEPVTEEPENQE